MSAYVVDKEHIDVMVGSALAMRHRFYFYHEGESHEVTHMNTDEIGQMLWNECVRSVSHRYPNDSLESLPGRTDSPWLTPYAYDAYKTPPLTPVEILKAIRCYEYQACEHPEWETSQAFAFCDQLRHAAIDALPGYNDAPWSWGEDEINAKRTANA